MVTERVQQRGYEVVSDVDEELMPRLRYVVGVVQRDDAYDQLTPEQACCCNQGLQSIVYRLANVSPIALKISQAAPRGLYTYHPTKYVNPSSDPAQYWHPLPPADDSYPVVLPHYQRKRRTPKPKSIPVHQPSDTHSGTPQEKQPSTGCTLQP